MKCFVTKLRWLGGMISACGSAHALYTLLKRLYTWASSALATYNLMTRLLYHMPKSQYVRYLIIWYWLPNCAPYIFSFVFICSIRVHPLCMWHTHATLYASVIKWQLEMFESVMYWYKFEWVLLFQLIIL